ncbi:FAD-dependent oxidoreductase [Actinoplanes sp. NBRC 103695]|uniref:FAD-dependent oxidoreductase n=1 Tax=Actinoplanes sp. NBRC 103695 TaxID=3032202 RepID=UPI0024A2D720|nr:FAD-dependent oxidoreductase [Actinoplanes sp. NBRC 103695]GLY93852.1 amine oxidase [Actinoplanes sp. NBRC 103695]
MRIAVVGAGITGLSAAWMLDGSDHEVVLFEESDVAGGHAHTLTVRRDGVDVHVDTAFSNLTSATHPTFKAFLERLGIGCERSVATFALSSRPRRRNLMVVPSARPAHLASAARPTVLRNLVAFGRAIDAAVPLEVNGDWTLSVRDYLARLPPAFVSKVMGPTLAAIVGTSAEEALDFSARAAMKFLVCPRIEGTRASLEALKVEGGVSSYVRALLGSLKTVTVRLNAEIVAVRKEADGFVLVTRTGEEHTFDQVVLATPAYKTAEMLAPLPGAEPLRRLLERIEYYETAIAVHADPSYMPASRGAWSYVNMLLDDRGECEKTFWSGMGEGVDVFRSWVTLGSSVPRDRYAMYRYQHPRMTPEYYRIQARLAALDPGSGGLWLAGSYLDDVDTHESGLRSAMEVVRRLHPESENLNALTVPA